MWVTYVSPHQDPKKMAKRKETFLPLSGDKKQVVGVSEEQKENFLKAYKKWQTQVS